MSFDLYFLPRMPRDLDWDDVEDRLEALAAQDRSPTADDFDLWDRVIAAVKPLVPEGQVLHGVRSRMFDDGVGLQLNLSPGEISISTPYWFEGDEAVRVVEKLRKVAAAVEEVTGLVCYDPQAEMAFLQGGADAATGTFDKVQNLMDTELHNALPDQLKPAPRKKPRWAFWRR